MKDHLSIHQRLQELKPVAERTILKDLEVTPQLEQRILQSVNSEGPGLPQVRTTLPKRLISIVFAFFVVAAGALTTIGLLSSQGRASRSPALLSVAAITVAPVAATAALLTKHPLRSFEARPNQRPSMVPAV